MTALSITPSVGGKRANAPFDILMVERSFTTNAVSVLSLSASISSPPPSNIRHSQSQTLRNGLLAVVYKYCLVDPRGDLFHFGTIIVYREGLAR